ncbi:MAG: sodium/glutamate symporter [Steroidobacteraceae bacterium]
MLELDLVHTVAFGGLVLLGGYALQRAIPVFGRLNIPAPVLGGLIVAVIALIARSRGTTLFQFDTTLQGPLNIAFFTSIGFGASLSLLKVGGPLVMRFFALATAFAIVQNLVGAGIATLFGLDPLFGVLAGSVTLTGGPATGLAFAPLFEKAGVEGAAAIAVAVAMGGIVAGAVVGGPVGTYLVRRHDLHAAKRSHHKAIPVEMQDVVEDHLPHARSDAPAGEDGQTYTLLKNLVAVLTAMWAGFWISKGFAAVGATLPAYIGAMLAAALLRNIDDMTGWFGLSQKIIDEIGSIALSLFLVMALMTLKLWDLAGLAAPLVVILLAQVLLVALVCLWPVFQVMGRDYESAVMSGGFIGFMLGTTANAMAVMRTLVERFGPAPKAFFVAPMVGAFFIDFTNALLITACLNIF